MWEEGCDDGGESVNREVTIVNTDGGRMVIIYIYIYTDTEIVQRLYYTIWYYFFAS